VLNSSKDNNLSVCNMHMPSFKKRLHDSTREFDFNLSLTITSCTIHFWICTRHNWGNYRIVPSTYLSVHFTTANRHHQKKKKKHFAKRILFRKILSRIYFVFWKICSRILQISSISFITSLLNQFILQVHPKYLIIK